MVLTIRTEFGSLTRSMFLKFSMIICLRFMKPKSWFTSVNLPESDKIRYFMKNTHFTKTNPGVKIIQKYSNFEKMVKTLSLVKTLHRKKDNTLWLIII